LVAAIVCGRVEPDHKRRKRLGVLSNEQDFIFLLLFSFVAGLEPAIDEKRLGFSMPGWVYIMTNRPNGTLYVGITDDLPRRT
jgi:hypothetical protein